MRYLKAEELMSKPEEWHLFEKLDDGSISDKDFEFLQKRLKEDPGVRKTYRAYMDMSSSLQDMADCEADEAWEVSQPGKKKSLNFPAITFAAIAASLAIIFYVNVSQYKDLDSDPEFVEVVESGYARIKLTANVVWNGTDYEQGNYLQGQIVKFDQGLINLEFENGVETVIEGPAEFKIIDEMKMVVKAGKIKANVPKSGHGFTIETDNVDIVDLGTVFGVEVIDGKVDVQVIDGLVKLQENKKDIREITAGRAVSIDNKKEIQKLTYTPDRFKGVNELRRIKRELARNAYRRWKAFVETNEDNLDLLAYYSFFNDEKWGRKLPNKKAGAAEESYGLGKFIARKPGRFSLPGSAFLFDQLNSKVDINLPETMTEMTMMCWVNIESTDNHYNTLLESQNRTPGAPGWYIRRRMMLLSLHRPGGATILRAPASFVSPRMWDQTMRDTWMHLGVRITRDKIAFFKNGYKLSEVENTVNYDYLQIGSAEIGNSTAQAKRRSLPLNFHGKMDELIIVKKALSDAEIRKVYKNGKPE